MYDRRTDQRVLVPDLLRLLAEYGRDGCNSCAGSEGGGGGGGGGGFDASQCVRAPRETTYSWDGPGGPLGDTGLLGWTPVNHHVGSGADDAPECRLHQYYMAGEQSSGLTSWYPGVRLRGHPLPPPSSPARAWTAAWTATSVPREERSF